MKLFSTKPIYHITYWIFVLLVLTLTFGLSWDNGTTAFYFITMLFPVVLGTSYFFNYFLVSRYFLTKKYKTFALYTFYTVVVSLYLEIWVLMFAFIVINKVNYDKLDSNAADTILLAIIMYLLVFIGSFLLLLQQIKENKQTIAYLKEQNEKMKKSFLEIISNRKTVKIPYDDILYIESLSEQIIIHTNDKEIISKEKISHLEKRLPDVFLRIHRSFIVNREKITTHSYTEIRAENTSLTIGRSYRTQVKKVLKNNL